MSKRPIRDINLQAEGEYFRRELVAGIALAPLIQAISTANAAPTRLPVLTPVPPSTPTPVTVPAQPHSGVSYELLEVGPGKAYPSLTSAGVYMAGPKGWGGLDTVAARAKRGFHVVLSGPDGYYTNDSGSHSRRWQNMMGWPAYEGNLSGPVIIETTPGHSPVLLDTDGYGDGVLYYQTGLFQTFDHDATFRRIRFKGFHRQDGYGNYAAVRFGPVQARSAPHILFEDCEFSENDNGLMGESGAGASITLRRCYFHDNGKGMSGRVHAIYIGHADLLTIENCLSTTVNIGHLVKSRAASTVIRNTRLIGNGGTESACLDVPNAGVLDIDGLVCQKSDGSDASWIIHYSGEQGNGPFHVPSSVKIRNMVLVAPKVLARHTSWPIVGFANQSLNMVQAGEPNAFVVPVDAAGVSVFGLTPDRAGLPCELLATAPALDLRSPLRP